MKLGRRSSRTSFTGDTRDGEDPFGTGGITWQLDNLLLALETASQHDDAYEYASLAAQLAVILGPKLEPQEYENLSTPPVLKFTPDEEKNLSRRERRREYERRLFIASRNNVYRMLRIASERGIYAKKDESPIPTEDIRSLAIND